MSTTEYRARIINGEDDIEIVASDRSALSINQARSESIGFDIGPSTERCTAKADEILAAYLFGNEVTVVDHDNWNTDDPEDFTKIVYASYEDSPPEADSHKISFHVRFDKSGSVTDGYALDMAKGCDIGCRGDLHA